MKKTYKVGIVGCGESGQTYHLPACSSLENVTIEAICDLRPELVLAMGEKYGIKDRYTEVDAMLADKALDIAVICTPTFTHKQLAEKALRAGCHVLLEKPAVESLKDLEALIALQKALGRKVMVHQNYRWLKISKAVKKAIDDGLIGEPYWLELTFFSWGTWGNWWASQDRLIVQDMFPHPVDLTRYWFGAEVEEVYAHIPRLAHYPMKGEGFAAVMLKLSGDKSANIVGSWASKCGPMEQWIEGRIEGTGGCMSLQFNEELEIFSEKLGSRVIPLTKEDDPWPKATGRMMAHFVQCIDTDRRPLTDLADNRGTIAAVLAAYDSCRMRRAVRPNACEGSDGPAAM